jgi:conjugative relaxase-like TrwC/TraI family protein
VRFAVTALGAKGGRTVGSVVADIVRYLKERPGQAQDSALGPGAREQAAGTSVGGAEPSRYYADVAERSGRWLGHGAGGLGLHGDVDARDFRTVLGGRHPGTGERLISARGSAGRVAELGAGTVAGYAPDGEALYGIADAATVLGWSRADVADAAADGHRLAAARVFAVLAGAGTGPGTEPGTGGTGMDLVPFVDRDGTVFVRDSELARLEALVNESRSAPIGDGTSGPREVVTAAEAARLIGTSRSYVARLCRTWEEHRDEITAAAGSGTPSRRAYIEAARTVDGGWAITREDLAAFIGRRRQPAVRVGYDVTATTEKSLSVLALLGGAEVRAEVLEAIEIANDTGMAWLERNAAVARAGREVVGVEGWTAASFQHLTSRRLDPFVHHHNVVANTVVDEHGVRRALDARRLYRRVAAGSAIATAQVRWELVTRLGVSFRPARHGGWEIAGIDDSVIDEFSARTREIRDTIRELEDALGRTTTMVEFQAVVAGSRPAKRSADEDAVLEQWWARAGARGLDSAALARCTGTGVRRRRPPVMTRRRRQRILDDLGRAVTEQQSVFSRVDVLATLVDLPEPSGDGPVVLPAAALEELTDAFLASDRAVRLRTTSGRRDRLARKDGTTITAGDTREPEFSTTEMLAVQARALHNYEAGTRAGAGTVPPELIAEALAQLPGLSAEQRHLVASFCTSGDRAQSAVGRPGTGKTYAMRAAVAAWEAAGYRVLGAAVKAEAARHLGDECGIPPEPLAWYLNRLDDPARSPLDGRTVLVVDEASTIGDRDLAAVLAAAHRDGAALRFVGDPAQHGAVTAGGLWRVITERNRQRTPELTESRRVRHAGDRAAAEALREGRADVALAELEAAGHLHIVDDDRDLYAQLLGRWWEARQAGAPHPMADRRNDQRLVLNRLARTMRRHHGELGDDEIVASGDRRYAVGDEVTARMGDRNLHPDDDPAAYVRNGARGVVTGVVPGRRADEDRIEVVFDGLGTIVIPRPFFDEHADQWGRSDVGIDHAYAVTSYAVEGLTFDQSTSHVDPHSTRPEVYVDITRGRNENHVFVTRADDALDGERLPAVPTPGIDRQLESRLSTRAGEPVAIDLDLDAGDDALAQASVTAGRPACAAPRGATAAQRAVPATRLPEAQICLG